MPDIEMDNATHFIVSSGLISCYNNTDEQKASYISEIGTMLEAMCSALGIANNISRPSIRPDQGAVFYRLNIPSMYGITMEIVNQPNGNVRPAIVFKFINDSSLTLTSKFPPVDETYFLYWAIYKSKAEASNYDIGITMAYQKTSEWVNLRWDGPMIGDSLNPKILNSLAIHSPFTFSIVTVVDSIYEGETPSGYKGILIPEAQLTWGDDAQSSIGKTFNNDNNYNASSIFVPYQDAGGQDVDYNENMGIDVHSSLLLTSDCSLYPPTEGTKKNGSFGSICPAIYLTPSWSPSSRCISINTKTLQWGGQLENDDGEHPKHCGPQYIQIGSKYFLKTMDIYMPVDEIPSS